MAKRRASSSEAASAYKRKGHADARQFALAIGMSDDYQNDMKAKKDVIDPDGDAHSVKGGKKKWQVFLYGYNRFQQDVAFGGMNGMSDLLCKCIEAFPSTFSEYQADKLAAKTRLRKPMVDIANKLQAKRLLRAFLEKSFFNGKEVEYLTVKEKDIYHVFSNGDVIRVLSTNLTVTNSQARQKGQTPEQKVVFQCSGKTLGELEMRNDSETHYREIRFNILKPKIVALLFKEIPASKTMFDGQVITHGTASTTFGRWLTRKKKIMGSK